MCPVAVTLHGRVNCKSCPTRIDAHTTVRRSSSSSFGGRPTNASESLFFPSFFPFFFFFSRLIILSFLFFFSLFIFPEILPRRRRSRARVTAAQTRTRNTRRTAATFFSSGREREIKKRFYPTLPAHHSSRHGRPTARKYYCCYFRVFVCGGERGGGFLW